jgi:RNA polymerase sigma-70 factor (ECF subfamily)
VNAAQTERDSILARVRERIVMYATSRVGRDAAEDLAQDTLMLLNQKYAHLSSRDDLVPVAVRIMQFKIRTLRRGIRPGDTTTEGIQVPDPDPDPETTAHYQQLRKTLMEAIEKLGGRCREIFMLKLLGYNFIEIKDRMGANSIDTIYVWDFRCRKELKKLTAAGGDA